jgi:hypothetical protein
MRDYAAEQFLKLQSSCHHFKIRGRKISMLFFSIIKKNNPVKCLLMKRSERMVKTIFIELLIEERYRELMIKTNRHAYLRK